MKKIDLRLLFIYMVCLSFDQLQAKSETASALPTNETSETTEMNAMSLGAKSPAMLSQSEMALKKTLSKYSIMKIEIPKEAVDQALLEDQQLLKSNRRSYADYTANELESKPCRSFELYVAFDNDNTLFTKDSDDGRSYEYDIQGRKALDCGLSLSGRVYGGVFTKQFGPAKKRDDGNFDVPYHFTNERLVQLTLDSLAADQVIFWRAGIGWHQLSSKKHEDFLNKLTEASRHEDVLNGWIDYISQPKYVEDGMGTRDGVAVIGSVGAHAQVSVGGFSLAGQTEVGLRYSSLHGASYLFNETAATYQTGDQSVLGLKVDFGSEFQWHKEGTAINPYLDVSASHAPITVGVRYTRYLGELNNYQIYNYDDESLLRAYLRVDFGK